MKAIISGAGIAGLALAWWLAADGWEVVLLEKEEKLRGQGYMIDFFGSGYEVAKRMKLAPRLDAARYPVTGVSWISKSGRTVARLDVSQIADLLNGEYVSLMRGDLESVLFEALPSSVNVCFGTKVKDLTIATDGVSVALSNGETEHADLLVGADGIHSTIRRTVFGNEKKFFRYLGYHTAAFIFENPTLAASLNNEFKIMSVPGREMGFYPLRGGRVASFFVHCARDMTLPRDDVAELRCVYGDLGWIVNDALDAAEKLPSIYYDQVAQIDMPHWTKGRVALIGDACMAVSLLAGQGASMAMASAYVLSEELRRQRSVEKTLQSYEARLKAPIKRKQREARQTANWIVPPTRFYLFARNTLMGLARIPGGGRILAKMFLSGAESVING
jgi:2-polyprenyl-6-methoxyphenol hydroxylase-like FAD-dependent oxidoreductase